MAMTGAEKPPVFIALTGGGAALAARLAKRMGGSWHAPAAAAGDTMPPPDCMPDCIIGGDRLAHIRDVFLGGYPLVGICAAGILIRALAPHLAAKHESPPVLAVSADGAHVVPLLGGHHGGNALAARIAAELGGVAACTNAGEAVFGIALDAPPPSCDVVVGDDGDGGMAKRAMAALLAGRKACLSDDLPAPLAPPAGRWREWLAPVAADDGDTNPLRFHLTLAPGHKADCVFHPKRVLLGLGASRGCPPGEMAELIARALAKAGIAPAAIDGVYSMDLKADEAAILHAASSLGHRLRVFTKERLARETPRLENPSQKVSTAIGVPSVAEASALAAAGADGVLLLPKCTSPHATAALALRVADERRDGDSRKAGRVMVVGIGPGQSAWRTPEATALVASADELVGYGFYIGLLGGLAAGKKRRDFALGEEEARCRYALEQAATGRDIALVCSGDGGIYAMGALVHELKEGMGMRVEVITAPGVTAMQAAAARTGAMLGHDFCAISLSDLLTPWEQIEARLHAAGQGDFVIAFYNPASQKRRGGIAEAFGILRQYRDGTTPVVLARNLGRKNESITHATLADVDCAAIDMMTTVLVGARATRRGAGGAVFTPRGYATATHKKGAGR